MMHQRPFQYDQEPITVNFSEIASRLSSIGTPFVSVGWVPAKADAAVARKVIRFLEDRRMLFNACAQEEPHYCYLSALEIRKTLTEELADVPEKSDLFKHLISIRAACRTFLDNAPRSKDGFECHDMYSMRSGQFFIALGELRATIGYHVAIMAAKWEINVEKDLAQVLPGRNIKTMPKD
jgi:hypothetical protein